MAGPMAFAVAGVITITMAIGLAEIGGMATTIVGAVGIMGIGLIDTHGVTGGQFRLMQLA